MKYIAFLFALVCQLSASVLYVDSSSSGLKDGTSWANAWTGLEAIKANAGDTVYISGGPSGQTRTYAVPSIGYWNPPSGTAALPITYKIGQDSAHNGVAQFTPSKSLFLSGPRNFTLSGDAGDGVQHFKLLGFGAQEVISNVDAFHLEYVAGDVSSIGQIRGVINFEINNCNFNIVSMTADRAFYVSSQGTWSIHDNTIRIPNSGPGTGADGIQCGSSKTGKILRNHIIGYTTAYTGGQHQDGFQSTGADSDIEIAFNDFESISNYAVYGDAYYSGFTNINVHDNLVRLTSAALNKGSPVGIVFGTDGGYIGSSPCTFNNVTIIHNLIVDYFWSPVQNVNACIALNNVTNKPTVFTSCAITDNLMVNGTTTPDTNGNTTTTVKNNTAMTAAQATSYFKWYVPYGVDNDYSPFFSGVPPVIVPPVVVPPVVVPPTNAKISTSVSTISADGKSITTVITFDKSIYQ